MTVLRTSLCDLTVKMAKAYFLTLNFNTVVVFVVSTFKMAFTAGLAFMIIVIFVLLLKKDKKTR